MADEQRQIIALNRRLGEAEGILQGWLWVTGKDEAHLKQCQDATRKFLEAPSPQASE